MLNDSYEVFLIQKKCLHFRLSIGIDSGASERAFAEIACLCGKAFLRFPLEQLSLGFSVIGTVITGISFSFGETVSPQNSDLEFLHLEQNY